MDNDYPKREDIHTINIERQAKLALHELRLAIDDASKAYKDVLEGIRQAIPTSPQDSATWIRSSAGSLDESSRIYHTVASRMLKREVVLQIILDAASPAAAILPRPDQPTTRLSCKLRAGDVVPSAQAAAKRARLAWASYERSFSSPLPDRSDPVDFLDLRGRVTADAADAQRVCRQTHAPYGDKMLGMMQEKMAALARSLPQTANIDSRLLMGLVYDLTGQCEIWWSDEFDVDQACSDGSAK